MIFKACKANCSAIQTFDSLCVNQFTHTCIKDIQCYVHVTDISANFYTI